MRFWVVFAMLAIPLPALAAPAPDRLERVVIVMRHGVRSAMSSPAELGRYSAKPWPAFAVPPGHLTAKGGRLVTLLGRYYRTLFHAEGLLAEGDCSVFYWATPTQRTEATANALAAGLTPGCRAVVHGGESHASEPDPVRAVIEGFGPKPDGARMLAAIKGRIGGNLAAWDRNHAADLAVFEALLLQCRQTACTAEERSAVERPLGATPIRAELDPAGMPVLTSPALQVAGIAESLMMGFVDGLPFEQLGWRGLTAERLTRALVVHGAGVDLRTRTQEIGRMTSGPLALAIVATLGGAAPGARPLGDGEKIVVLSAHDGTVTMLAGLLGLDWILPSYGGGQAAPGGGLVFERWRRGRDGAVVVRVRYIAQSLTQLRDALPLSLDAPPESAALFIPRCSDATATFDCPLTTFGTRVADAVGANR